MLKNQCLRCGSKDHLVAQCKQAQLCARFLCQNCNAMVHVNDRGVGCTVVGRGTKRTLDGEGVSTSSTNEERKIHRRESSTTPTPPPVRTFLKVRVSGKQYSVLAWYFDKRHVSPYHRRIALKTCARGALELRHGDHKTLKKRGFAQREDSKCLELLPKVGPPTASWNDTACDAIHEEEKIQLRRRATVKSCRNVLFSVDDLKQHFPL